MIQGVGAGGTGPIAMALAGDIFQRGSRSRAMGILEASNGIGKVVSPILGSAVALIVWFAPFYVYAVLSVPVAVGIHIYLHEPKRSSGCESVDEYVQGIVKIFNKRGFLLLGYF